MRSIVQDAIKPARSRARSIHKAARRAASNVDQVWSQAGDIADDLADTGYSTARSLYGRIEERPLLAVFGALATGFALGALMRRR